MHLLFFFHKHFGQWLERNSLTGLPPNAARQGWPLHMSAYLHRLLQMGNGRLQNAFLDLPQAYLAADTEQSFLPLRLKLLDQMFLTKDAILRLHLLSLFPNIYRRLQLRQELLVLGRGKVAIVRLPLLLVSVNFSHEHCGFGLPPLRLIFVSRLNSVSLALM